jgi:S-methylmethionine-dependent homocysteine/selenocysteine methylase
LFTAPEVVRQIHLDYILAGADIITTNTYGIIRRDLAKIGLEDRFAELNSHACRLASEARAAVDRPVLIAGSLPPLRGSYRPDLVGALNEIEPLYLEQAGLLAPHVDLLLCETIGEAVASLSDLPVTGFLVNCCAPESITHALLGLLVTGVRYFGAYTNTFAPIPEDWTLDGNKSSDGWLTLRQDLGPGSYALHVADWLEAGATVVGGCCGTRPAHISYIHERLIQPFRSLGSTP